MDVMLRCSGYDYPCAPDSSGHEVEPTDRFCPIKFVPFRGVNCSDAAGHEMEFHLIQDTLDNNESLTGRMWDSSVSSPWYNYKAAGALSAHHYTRRHPVVHRLNLETDRYANIVTI